MTLPPFRFDPADGTGKAYLFRRPTFAEKTYAFRRAVHAAGGVYHSEFALLAAAEQGVRAFLAAPEDAAHRDECLARIARYRTLLRTAIARRQAERRTEETVLPPKTPEEMTEPERADAADKAKAAEAAAAELSAAADAVSEVGETLRRSYPRYAAMEADREAYWPIRGMVALGLFLVGWEGFPAPPAIGREGVSERDLAEIPPEHITAVGIWCEALFAPGDALAKNSSSPPATPETAASATGSSTSLH